MVGYFLGWLSVAWQGYNRHPNERWMCEVTFMEALDVLVEMNCLRLYLGKETKETKNEAIPLVREADVA